VAASVIENRVNALGVVEPLVQTQGSRRIIVELPGIQDPDQAIATIRETALLEFIDAGTRYLPPPTVVRTSHPQLASEGAETHSPGEVPVAPSGTPTSTLEIAPPSQVLTPSGELTGTVPAGEGSVSPTDNRPVITDTIFATVLTGDQLETAYVQRDESTGEFLIGLEMTDEGAQIFENYTRENIGTYLAIALDKEIISSPVIETAIPEGKAVIRGNFTLESAQQLAIQLRSGRLPVTLNVETTRTIGPTLGQDSIQRSLQAGIVGLPIVLLFMLIYYRMPGLLADLALILYGLINLAVYKVGWPVLLIISLLLILSYFLDRRDVWPLALGSVLLVATVGLAAAGFVGVTLTLPAITGFILSTGMAVDANILVFERMKEELRAGRSLSSAMEAGFSRAWTSIRDSNISTLITCAILFYFGSTFGAGTVKGFAVTLALGVVINLFTAITVTRTFMRLAVHWMGDRLEKSHALLGA
jgi:protein-export membrane protein SecD